MRQLCPGVWSRPAACLITASVGDPFEPWLPSVLALHWLSCPQPARYDPPINAYNAAYPDGKVETRCQCACESCPRFPDAEQEPMVVGEGIHKFNNNFGAVGLTDPKPYLQAFSHWTYEVTNHTLMVVDVQVGRAALL